MPSICLARQCDASRCPFKRLQSASGSLPVLQKTPNFCQERKWIAMKKMKTNKKYPFFHHFLENSFISLNTDNPQVKGQWPLRLEKWKKSMVMQWCLSYAWLVQYYFLQRLSPVWVEWVRIKEVSAPSSCLADQGPRNLVILALLLSSILDHEQKVWRDEELVTDSSFNN